MSWNAPSTFVASLADVSKKIIFPWFLHHYCARWSWTWIISICFEPFSRWPYQVCYRERQMGNFLGLLVDLTSKIHLSSYPKSQMTTILNEEYLWVGDIVNKNATISTSIESSSERLKSFLTRCVPDLKWNIFITCRVTILSSIITSLAIKSAPTVALYCCVNRALTY